MGRWEGGEWEDGKMVGEGGVVAGDGKVVGEGEGGKEVSGGILR